MIEYYMEIRLVHISAVVASGILFFIRGLGVYFGGRWAMAAPVRYVSYMIDTTLLTAALMLMTIVQQYPFVHGWLTVKIILLILYIVLGTFALKRGETRVIRLGCWFAALAVYGFIITVARTHHPLGFLSGLG